VLLASICARRAVVLVGAEARAFYYVLLFNLEGHPGERYALHAEEEFDLTELKGLSELDIEVAPIIGKTSRVVIYLGTDKYEPPPRQAAAPLHP
jgi:hypothetical protein